MGMFKIFRTIALAMRDCTVKFEHFLVDCRECLDLTGLFLASIFKIHECFLNSFLTNTSELSDLQRSEENVTASAPQKIGALNVKNIEPSKKSFENMKQSGHSENKKPSGHSEKMKISGQKMKISGHSENINPSGHSENIKPSGHSDNMKPLGHSDNMKPLGHSDNMKPSGQKIKISGHSENIKSLGHSENKEPSGHSEKMNLSGHSENKKPSGHSDNMKPLGRSDNMKLSGQKIKISGHSESMKPSGHSENMKSLGHSEKMKIPGLSENMKISGHSEILKPLGHPNESRIYSFPGQAKQSLVPPDQLSRSLSQDSLTGHFVSGNYMTRSSNGQKKKFDKWEPPHKKLDLHKKTVTEAVESFYRFTNRQLQYYKENGYRDEDKYIFVITGHCKNRPDRVARIKPEIKRILHEEQLSHFWFNNGGEVMIEFDCFEQSGPMTNDQLMDSESMACNCEDELGYLSC
ncbi:bromodomain-containing protein [Biomphalaria glabrata]|uniref:Smr domain-containing protein n=1 Tax=Biomphalaria glabrata TaxID=6526 RepID=A0A2C9JYJ9_BIOGL|nr:bromodomain-containing protein [Biomphalaria glabrata]